MIGGIYTSAPQVRPLPAWLCARDLLATAMNADHVANSGHVIGLDQPAVVVDAIRSVVGSAQRGG